MTGRLHPRVLTAAAGLALLCPAVLAQDLTILLVHGKTGKPFGNQNVTVEFWWENPASPDSDKWTPIGWNGTVVHIDSTGTGHVEVPAKATAVYLRAGPKMGKEPFRTPYTVCNGGGDLQRLEIGAILQRGFVPGNLCSSRLKIEPVPGKIVYFATPIPWWRPDFQ